MTLSQQQFNFFTFVLPLPQSFVTEVGEDGEDEDTPQEETDVNNVDQDTNQLSTTSSASRSQETRRVIAIIDQALDIVSSSSSLFDDE